MSSRAVDPARTVVESRSPIADVSVYGDLSIPWDATLIQPTKYWVGSAQVLVVEVTAPMVLDYPVSIAVGERYEAALWQGEPAQRRRATVVLGVSSGLTPGLRNVRVKVNAGGETPILKAGTIRVAR